MVCIITGMNPAFFLDRDGVVIENIATYVRSWADVVFFPGALPALARLSGSPYKIVIVTNQSVVGRGIISFSAAQEINKRLVEVIEEAGGRVDGLFMCPHDPKDSCTCRKPNPGLLFQAASLLSLDLNRSILVGDALTDIQAGQNAGVRTNILVRTGRGADQSALPEAHLLAPFLIFNQLEDVVSALLSGLLS
jgi:D-glycero-D-manno-heptose 1,7-bisphosphate phosphatase